MRQSDVKQKLTNALRDAFAEMYGPDEESAVQAADAALFAQGVVGGVDAVEVMMRQWRQWYSGDAENPEVE